MIKFSNNLPSFIKELEDQFKTKNEIQLLKPQVQGSELNALIDAFINGDVEALKQLYKNGYSRDDVENLVNNRLMDKLSGK